MRPHLRPIASPRSPRLAVALAGTLLVLSGCAPGAIGGRVLDTTGSPVPAARVTLASGRGTTTDAAGNFRLARIRPSQQLPVTVEAAGFANTLQLFQVAHGSVTRKDIFLLRQRTAQFGAASGGTISLSDGTQVLIPAGALVKPNGQPAVGTVTAGVASIDPGNPAELLAAPGELAVSSGGVQWQLVSGGMVKVDLTDAQGDRVNLAPGRTAEVRMPRRPVTRSGVAVGQDRRDTTAIATGLYLFNTESRQWELVDTLKATPGDNFLRAQTPSLGPWLNFDKPETRACLAVRVLTPAGAPRINTNVVALGVDYNGFDSRFTDGAGRAQLIVLRNAHARLNAGSTTTPPIPTPGVDLPCADAGTITF